MFCNKFINFYIDIAESETTMTTESTTGTSTTAAITATTVAVTTTTSTDEEGTLNMKFSMNRTYISDYADSTSDAYKTLETEVTDEVGMFVDKQCSIYCIFSETF